MKLEKLPTRGEIQLATAKFLMNGGEITKLEQEEPPPDKLRVLYELIDELLFENCK